MFAGSTQFETVLSPTTGEAKPGLLLLFALSSSLLSKQMPEECFPVNLGSQAAPRGSTHPF